MKKQFKQFPFSTFKIIFSLLLISVFLMGCIGCHPMLSPSEEDGDEELVLLTQRDQKLKVLQFTDMHFGEEGTTYHNADVKRTLAFIDYAIKTEQPDLIVLLGDNMMSQGVKGVEFLVETFDQYKIPYTLIYGNHDAWKTATPPICFTNRDLCKKERKIATAIFPSLFEMRIATS